jgi:hypothetical protein
MRTVAFYGLNSLKVPDRPQARLESAGPAPHCHLLPIGVSQGKSGAARTDFADPRRTVRAPG